MFSSFGELIAQYGLILCPSLSVHSFSSMPLKSYNNPFSKGGSSSKDPEAR